MSNDVAATEPQNDILTPVFRLSYPQLFTAKAYGKNAKPEYSMIMIFPKDEQSRLVGTMKAAGLDDLSIRASFSPEVSLPNPNTGKAVAAFGALKRAASAAAMKKWQDRCQNPDFFKALRSPFRPGDDGSYGTKDGFGPDVIFIKATSKRDQPELFHADGKTKITQERDLYGGCFARAVISAAAYDPTEKGEPGKKGVSFYVRLVQFVRGGPSFGGGGSKASLIDDVQGAPSTPSTGTGSTGGSAPSIGGW